MLCLQSKFLHRAVTPGVQSLATKSKGWRTRTKQRDSFGIAIREEKQVKYKLRQEFVSDPDITRKIKGNEEAEKVFGVELGDKKDAFNLDLYNLYQDMLQHECNKRVRHKQHAQGYSDTGIATEKDTNVKTVVVKHVKMKYLAEKLTVDPVKLRGPQIKYHPHMEVRVWDRQIKNQGGREEVMWNKANYARCKKAEYAKSLGNRYDSYYLYKREVAQNTRLTYSRNNFFFKWVYFHADTEQPYELHAKEAALMHRWTEYKEERDSALRQIELQDIQKYAHVTRVLGIPPIYLPTHKLPKPKWFRNNTISNLQGWEIARLQAKREQGAVSSEEADKVEMPARPARFNELIVGWHNTDQNRVLDSDYHYGTPRTTRDPVPLPGSLRTAKSIIEPPQAM